jgi:hypothetical protein
LLGKVVTGMVRQSWGYTCISATNSIEALFADPERQALEQAREAAGTIIPASMEVLRLVEY